MFTTASIKVFKLMFVFSLIISIHVPVLSGQNLICQRIPNLTLQQLQICQKSPEILSVIRKGIQMALNECQILFQNRLHLHPAWNCSTWIQNSLNRLYVNITDVDVKGTKEASFAHALFAAAVVYTLSEACTKSNFPYCSCGPNKSNKPDNQQMMFIMDENWPFNDDVVVTNFGSTTIPAKLMNNVPHPNQQWKWNGCVPNIQFGIETARVFLDSSEHQTMSPYSLVNLHNNNVGRRVIKDSLVFKCQCHGFSGSCTFRTCWHTVNTFRQATQLLYNRYTKAKMVSFNWLNKSFRHKFEKRIRSKQSLSNKLNNQLKHLQKAFMNITMFELNQSDPNRILVSDDGQTKTTTAFDHSFNIKASKRDLIYLKPSINHCHSLYQESIIIHNEQQQSQYSSVYNHQQKTLSCSVNESESSNHFNHGQWIDSWPPLESCDKLCCGKGYRQRTFFKTNQQCDCHFQFCCTIICKPCTVLTTVYECIVDQTQIRQTNLNRQNIPNATTINHIEDHKDNIT